MKINDTRKEFFDNLDEGTVFQFYDTISSFGMKLDEDVISEFKKKELYIYEHIPNAIDLKSGCLIYIEPSKFVEVLNCELIIK
jgi:hypothetical protein